MREYITLTIETVNLYYATKHFNGVLYSGYVGENLLSAPPPASQGVELYIPENNDEQRDPRMDDIYLVKEICSITIQGKVFDEEYYATCEKPGNEKRLEWRYLAI